MEGGWVSRTEGRGQTWRRRERQEDTEREGEMERETECKLASACSMFQAHERPGQGRKERTGDVHTQHGVLVLDPAVLSPRRRVLLCSHTVLFPFPVLSFTVPSTARAASLALQGRASSMARSPNGFFSFQPSLRDPVADCRLNYSHVR